MACLCFDHKIDSVKFLFFLAVLKMECLGDSSSYRGSNYCCWP